MSLGQPGFPHLQRCRQRRFRRPLLAGAERVGGRIRGLARYQGQSIGFDLKAVSAAVDGSRLEIDFANAAGTDRNNFLVIESTGSGLRIAVNEPTAAGGWTVDNFDAFTGNRTLVSGIDQSVSHHIDMRLTYVDGPNNDRIDIYLDGALIGSTTTFENYRDFSADLTPNPSQRQPDRPRILFRTGDAGQPHDGPGGLNQGFNIDNVTTRSTATRPRPGTTTPMSSPATAATMSSPVSAAMTRCTAASATTR